MREIPFAYFWNIYWVVATPLVPHLRTEFHDGLSKGHFGFSRRAVLIFPKKFVRSTSHPTKIEHRMIGVLAVMQSLISRIQKL